jgi:hypothetical protein
LSLSSLFTVDIASYSCIMDEGTIMSSLPVNTRVYRLEIQ